MKKTLLLCSVALLAITCVQAQRLADLGIAIGADNYLGDLGNEKLFPISSTNTGIAITLRNFLNDPAKSHMRYKPLSLEARISWHRIGYDETNPIGSKRGMELRNYLRGLGFRNDLFGASTHLTYTFYRDRNMKLNKQGLCFFVSAGVGIFYGVPKADLFNGPIDLNNRYYFWNDGTVRDAAEVSGRGNIIQRDGIYETNLRDWYTEGERASGNSTKDLSQRAAYSYTNVGFPVGFGFRKGLSKDLTLSMEVDYYYFLTDFLDDVSNHYATYSEIQANFPDDIYKQALAKYISDPTGRGTDGTLDSPYTSKRGSPKKMDAYTFVSLEIAYKIVLRSKGIYGQGQ